MPQPENLYGLPRNKLFCFLILFGLFFLSASGCGVGEYEARMDEQQKRVQYLDDENKYLEGKPLKLPEKKTEDKEALLNEEFFFRPPTGISTTPDERPFAGIVYRYASSNNAIFQDLLVAVAKTDKREKFVKDVLSQIPGLGAPKPHEVGQLIGQPVRYDSYHETSPNPTGPYAYFLRDAPPYQVALIFRPVANPASAANIEASINYSLGSLRVGPAAAQKLRTWKPPPSPRSTGRR